MGTVWGVLNVSIGGYHVNCFQWETNNETDKDDLRQDDGLFKRNTSRQAAYSKWREQPSGVINITLYVLVIWI